MLLSVSDHVQVVEKMEEMGKLILKHGKKYSTWLHVLTSHMTCWLFNLFFFFLFSPFSPYFIILTRGEPLTDKYM